MKRVIKKITFESVQCLLGAYVLQDKISSLANTESESAKIIFWWDIEEEVEFNVSFMADRRVVLYQQAYIWFGCEVRGDEGDFILNSFSLGAVFMWLSYSLVLFYPRWLKVLYYASWNNLLWSEVNYSFKTDFESYFFPGGLTCHHIIVSFSFIVIAMISVPALWNLLNALKGIIKRENLFGNKEEFWNQLLFYQVLAGWSRACFLSSLVLILVLSNMLNYHQYSLSFLHNSHHPADFIDNKEDRMPTLIYTILLLFNVYLL